jgi:hypothetical protein
MWRSTSILITCILCVSLALPSSQAALVTWHVDSSPDIVLECAEDGSLLAAQTISNETLNMSVQPQYDDFTGALLAIDASWSLASGSPESALHSTISFPSESTIWVEIRMGDGVSSYLYDNATASVSQITNTLNIAQLQASALYIAADQLSKTAISKSLTLESTPEMQQAAYIIGNLTASVLGSAGVVDEEVAAIPAGEPRGKCSDHTSTLTGCRECCDDRRSTDLLSCPFAGALGGVLCAGLGPFAAFCAAGGASLCGWAVYTAHRNCHRQCNEHYNVQAGE